MVLLPVAAARVRLVAFDVVIDAHDDSDIETRSSQSWFKKVFVLSWLVVAPPLVLKRASGYAMENS